MIKLIGEKLLINPTPSYPAIFSLFLSLDVQIWGSRLHTWALNTWRLCSVQRVRGLGGSTRSTITVISIPFCCSAQKCSHFDIISVLLQWKLTKWNFISCLINTQFVSGSFARYRYVGLVHSTATAGNTLKMPTHHWCFPWRTHRLLPLPLSQDAPPRCQDGRTKGGTKKRSCCKRWMMWMISGVSSTVLQEWQLQHQIQTRLPLGPKQNTKEEPEGQQGKLYLMFGKE